MQSLVMSPEPGERQVRHVGDTLRFSLTADPNACPANGWQARLRTNLGRARAFRREIIRARTARVAPFGASWHDVPLEWDGARWSREFVLTEVGFFAAKPYLLDPKGYQHWPHGPDTGVSVHPDWIRSANLIYCAFTRLFGNTRTARRLHPEDVEGELKSLEQAGFAVLPPSGTFRDLTRQLPHIIDRLGCRILHLLPVHPTPTTFARFGRMGSPYAALDMTAVDPALVEFDQRTTGVEQFCELTQAVHQRGARVFLDIVINHTGWGSRLYEEHPEFFRRESDGRFASPGAWGVVWEDLVELEQGSFALWDMIAEALLTWCCRGVDGFRCDAGYKIPTHVWQYITARVHTHFPDTVFLLEGLGGSWAATESLLTEGGMQSAYSELFQNYSGAEVQSYLDYALQQSDRVGTYVHYSETHDNDRLATRGRQWSLLRNRLCALTSVRGAFGFTCGVEWLAAEKIRVHERTGLAWDNEENLIEEIACLNRLLANHPAFFDGARLHRVSPAGSAVFALHRQSSDGRYQALVLINTNLVSPEAAIFLKSEPMVAGPWLHDLLGQPLPEITSSDATWTVRLPPAAACFLSTVPAPQEGHGNLWRRRRAQTAWALQQAAEIVPAEVIIGAECREALAEAIDIHPAAWLAAISNGATFRRQSGAPLDLRVVLENSRSAQVFPNVILWSAIDARRVTLVPPGWWLLIQDTENFRAHLQFDETDERQYAISIPTRTGYVACFPPRSPSTPSPAGLVLERFSAGKSRITTGSIHFLPSELRSTETLDPDGVVLLTNGRGGMARVRIDLGSVQSKYDCVLAANLHPTVPVDRHVFVKRLRAWINADGFLSALDRYNLAAFYEGPPAIWQFAANAGDGRKVLMSLEMAMVQGRNTTLLRFVRKDSDAGLKASLTLRVDLEDRSYHGETRRNPGADHHFSTHSHQLHDAIGFEFTPATDRHLSVRVDRGLYHPDAEWSQGIAHPIEQSRGQVDNGDAFSPGWFEIPMGPGDAVTMVLDAEDFPIPPGAAAPYWDHSQFNPDPEGDIRRSLHGDAFARKLARAATAFMVRRDDGRTVIAGYPWFLDWGRDTLIAARGLLAAGWHREVLQIIDVFARFADRGTLPNSIFGENASNRDTSDAPLWFATLLDDAAQQLGDDVLHAQVVSGGPTRLETVRLLLNGYLAGTPNGIRVDPESALVWSPSHFTWMDTNHPAGSPREGYPVDIQALWIRGLRLLEKTDAADARRWAELRRRAEDAIQQLYWLENLGWFADGLLAPANTPAERAVVDTALRPNMLSLVSHGIVDGSRARSSVSAALQHLLIPGGLRSLAPLPVSPPLYIRAGDGRLLNDPHFPYAGRYEGDEDTRRKPAYHNGTGWVWLLPMLCEAMVMAWDPRPEAVSAARSILGSLEPLLSRGCRGHLPEIMDGDAPHRERGCDAQAWSVTEALRVWLKLDQKTRPERPSS